jgi:dTMP kinase
LKGFFVTFEGPEGSGKSTQAARLSARLQSDGHEVVQVREPGGTRTGEAIREILQHNRGGEPLHAWAEVLLFAASRAQLVEQVVRPAVQRGAWVVSDRFLDSTTAYQGYGRGLDLDEVQRVNRLAVQGAIPDLTLLLDVPVRLGFERLAARAAAARCGRDRIESEETGFHERVRAGYLELAARYPSRFRVLDGALAPEAVEKAVWNAVRDARRRSSQARAPDDR